MFLFQTFIDVLILMAKSFFNQNNVFFLLKSLVKWKKINTFARLKVYIID